VLPELRTVLRAWLDDRQPRADRARALENIITDR